MLTISRIDFGGWPNCYRVKNETIELVITTDVGPRIIFFGFEGGHNEFAILPSDSGPVGGDEFRLYGGHRLWHAPEAMPRTYYPDNQPVQVERAPGLLRTTAPIEKTTGIQKQIDILMDGDGPHVCVIHRLFNHSVWPIELAPWALTVCAPGGVGIMPLPPEGEHAANLLPTTSISMWAYTKVTDPRWTWGDRFILLRHDPESDNPQKVGLYSPDGWAAYANREHLFVKTFAVREDAIYPDRGVTTELYTDASILEVETLGPMTRLEPGTTVEHIEDWYLVDSVPQPQNESDVIKHVLPHVVRLKTRDSP